MSSTSWEHLRDELQLLNACLLREVYRISKKNRQLDLLQGLVLTENDIVEILTNPLGVPVMANGDDDPKQANELRERIEKRSTTHPQSTALNQLSTLFQLERIE